MDWTAHFICLSSHTINLTTFVSSLVYVVCVNFVFFDYWGKQTQIQQEGLSVQGKLYTLPQVNRFERVCMQWSHGDNNNNNKTIKPFFGVTKTITCFRKVNTINSLQNIWNQQHCQDLLSIEFPCCGPCSRPVGVTVANLGPTYTEHQRQCCNIASNIALNCLDFLINHKSHSKNGLQPKLIRYDASVDTEAPNQSCALMAYFHCRTRIQIQTWTRIPNPMATWYYAEHISTDLDSDLDPFPIVFVQYRNPSASPNPNPSSAMEISH